jgi:hypothetical protein
LAVGAIHALGFSYMMYNKMPNLTKILFCCGQVNIKGKHGRTPLYLAAEEGHVYIVKLLLLHPHIDVNCR